MNQIIVSQKICCDIINDYIVILVHVNAVVILISD